MPTRTQHIGTITEMSSRYHNLQEQYHGLRNREPAPPPGGPVDVSTVLHGLKEMNRDLKKALDEARQRAVEAEARGEVGLEEVRAAQAARASAERAREGDAAALRAELAAARAQAARQAAAWEARLVVEEGRRRAAEEAAAAAEGRLAAALGALQLPE